MVWSSPATWGGTKPVAGASVLIPAGTRIALDENTPTLGELVIEGELSFAPNVLAELKAANIRVRGGALRAGSAAAPFAGRAIITLTDTDMTRDAAGMGTRGILVTAGGRLELYGRAPAVTWAKLDASASAGAQQLTLDRSVDWAAGDQIVVAPTEWYPTELSAAQSVHDAAVATDRSSLAAMASGKTLALAAPLPAFHWGRLQYATDAGMSLTRGTFTKPHPDAVDTLDERAEVGNLTRNIVVQGADDTAWRNSGFGAQVMVMERQSSLQLDGVELRRVGQAGQVGRYPIHWHLISYATDGSVLGDAAGHFVRNSAVWDSRNRCVVVHGTNGVEIRNNICFDIKGHAIFLEDGVERRNVIEGNLVLRTRSPTEALAVAKHEVNSGCGGASAYWLTNPDNTVRNNAAADAQGNGFWLSYPALPVKQSKLVKLKPQFMQHAPFEFNSSRSNGNHGLLLECAMIDDAGNLGGSRYSPTVDGSVFDWSNGVGFTLKGITTAKNRGGYRNVAINPAYVQWASADNIGRAFTGSVQMGSSLKQSLIVGKSLNDRQPYPSDAEAQLGVASYHSSMDIGFNTFVNFSNAGFVLTRNGWDRSSGAFGTDDYYIRAIEKGFARNQGNRLIGADAGYRALPPHLQPDYTPATNNNWTLSGAVWDPQGYWGTAGRWSVLDSPFLRDASCTALPARVPAGLANGLSCAGPYYGLGNMVLNRGLSGDSTSMFLETLDVTRLDAADRELGRWRVEQGYSSNFLGNMRHFAAIKGGTYVLRFPSFPNASAVKEAPRWVEMWVENIAAAGDSMLLGVHFNGSTVPTKVQVSVSPDYADIGRNTVALRPAATRAAVAAGAGDLYWQDSASQLVWVKLTPFPLPMWAGVTPNSDGDLYRAYNLRIAP